MNSYYPMMKTQVANQSAEATGRSLWKGVLVIVVTATIANFFLVIETKMLRFTNVDTWNVNIDTSKQTGQQQQQHKEEEEEEEGWTTTEKINIENSTMREINDDVIDPLLVVKKYDDITAKSNQVPVFYNLFVSSSKDEVRVLDMMQEQFAFLNPAVHKVFIRSIGVEINFKEKFPYAYHIRHDKEGDEKGTLQMLWQYCRDHPQKQVAYIHGEASVGSDISANSASLDKKSLIRWFVHFSLWIILGLDTFFQLPYSFCAWTAYVTF